MPKNQTKISEKIKPVSIVSEMERSYLDYALSVIVSRALPDIRDGLKPVQRRIVYAMHEQHIGPHDRYQKSAAVVGEVLKKYHPHGDTAVYDALVRMAQDFSLRYPLIDGQGNFGSVDGDSAAAMRYTECRLAPISEELLADIDKKTVHFVDNYSATDREPEILPSILPNILLNGASGIAVGMATNIPPHNLGEVVDALCRMIEEIKIHPLEKGYRTRTISSELVELGADFEIDTDLTVEDLMGHIKGPDFPTGGEIYDKEEIIRAYATGKGRILTRGRIEIEPTENGKSRIIITEIPYLVNKAQLVAKIAHLAKNKTIENITALRDESDREGLRIVVEIKRGAGANKILNQLYKHTPLQTAFNANMVGLLRREPKVLTLKMILEELLKWQKLVLIRRTLFLLLKAQQREHILLGLKIALDHLDEVISTIRKSQDAEAAKINLTKKFKLTEIQAQAILDMQLRRLARLERQKIEDELQEIIKEIDGYEALLAHPIQVMSTIKENYLELKEKYGDARRTVVHPGRVGEFAEEDLTQKEDILITLTRDGYVKRVKPSTFKAQKRGGKGVMGIKTKEGDIVTELKSANTLDTILFLTAGGKVHQVRGHEIPEGGRTSRGKAIVNVLDLESDEKVIAMIPITKKTDRKYLVFATEQGRVKRTALTEFENIRRGGITAIGIKKDDRLRRVDATTGKGDIILISTQGKSVRFKEEGARAMGRTASGVRGIKLAENDELVGMEVISGQRLAVSSQQKGEITLLTVTENGYGKKTEISEYPVQSRGGKGVLTMKVNDKTGPVVESKILTPKIENLFLVSQEGQVIRVNPQKISQLGRATQGVRVMRLAKNDRLAATASLD